METKETEIFRLSEIIARSMREELSDDERRMLDEWLTADERHRTMYAAFGREEVLAEQVRLRQTIDWQGDCRMFMLKRKALRRRRLLYRSLRYAAVFILLLSGLTVWFVNSFPTDGPVPGDEPADNRNRAFLTLTGGEQIVLRNDTMIDPVLSQRGAQIEIRENRITYSTEPAVHDNISCNTLETSRGGEYILTLSDGTRVWLNAESQLRYPVKFTGKQRTVYLVGEAYFDVHPDTAHPFIVISGPAEITVLGTSFNLRAYPEGDIVTTLVSGAVQMAEKIGGQSVRLAPGEQGCLEKTNGYIITKRDVDTYLYTAWKDGRLVFRDIRLEELFTILARWYDLEVFYLHPEVKDIRFTGDMDKTERFEDILRIIEQNRRVHFHVKGHAVSVSLQ